MSELRAEHGLLWRDDYQLSMHEADDIAGKLGFVYAEQLVKYLEECQETKVKLLAIADAVKEQDAELSAFLRKAERSLLGVISG